MLQKKITAVFRESETRMPTLKRTTCLHLSVKKYWHESRVICEEEIEFLLDRYSRVQLRRNGILCCDLQVYGTICSALTCVLLLKCLNCVSLSFQVWCVLWRCQ